MLTTIWLDDSRPAVDAASHTVAVETEVGRRAWTVAELAAFGDDLRATLDCTSGWFATQDWSGVRLDRLLDAAQGRSIVVRSVTGYSRRFPISDAPAILLATHVGGAPLDLGHGAPVRLVAPGRRGFWWSSGWTRSRSRTPRGGGSRPSRSPDHFSGHRALR